MRRADVQSQLRIEYADAGSAPETKGIPFGEDGWQNLEQLDLAATDSFRFTVTLAIGFGHEAGADNYSVFIVVGDRVGFRSIPPARKYHAMYFDKFDWRKIRQAIEQRVYACERGTLAQSVEELRKVFLWEFEGMKLSENRQKSDERYFADREVRKRKV